MSSQTYFSAPTDEFWLNTVRSLGSNSATDGFASIEELVVNGKLSARELRKLAMACRSLMDLSRDRASEMEAREKRPWEFAA